MSTPKQIKQVLSHLTATAPKFGRDKEGNSKPFTQSAIKIGGKPLRLRLAGTLFMPPMRNEHIEYGLKYKVRNNVK